MGPGYIRVIRDNLSDYDSGSQPGCRGTQGCLGQALRVPPNIEFTSLCVTVWGSLGYHFRADNGAANCF